MEHLPLLLLLRVVFPPGALVVLRRRRRPDRDLLLFLPLLLTHPLRDPLGHLLRQLSIRAPVERRGPSVFSWLPSLNSSSSSAAMFISSMVFMSEVLRLKSFETNLKNELKFKMIFKFSLKLNEVSRHQIM